MSDSDHMEEPESSSHHLEFVCLWLGISLAVLLAVPNSNVPFIDDLAIVQLFLVWPGFLFLGILLMKQMTAKPPRHLGLLVLCALAGSFHTSALLFHLTGSHDEDRIQRPVSHAEAGEDLSHIYRTREFSHGSGSYVMESLYTETDSNPINKIEFSFSGNRPRGPLPNWAMPLRVKPWSLQQQYWVALNQSAPRHSLLILSDRRGQLHSQNTLLLVIAVLLVMLPWQLVKRDETTTRGQVLLGLWLLFYQPWLAFLL